MKMQISTFVFVLLLVIVTARHYDERSETDKLTNDEGDMLDNVRRAREHSAGQMRHRRRAWHSSFNPHYGYDYNVPQNPYYPDYRIDQNQQDLLPQIYRLLDEISAYVKRPAPPPPPPQPIYVPYAVPYPVPQRCKCKKEEKGEAQPAGIENRFSDMVDDNQNWGLVDSNEGAPDEDDNDGSRPISFIPIPPKGTTKRKQVNVEHGSSQAGSDPQPPRPSAQEGRAPASKIPGVPAAQVPGMCDVFSLSCCNGSPQQQMQCFINVGCSTTYDNGKGCNKQRLLTIIDAYSKAYSPVN